MTIRTFYDTFGDPITLRIERRMVGAELYVVFTPFVDHGDGEVAAEEFKRATSVIAMAVENHLLLWPGDKYLARFVTGERIGEDDERWHEVQFKDRDDLRYPRWQQMVVSPYLNSREAA